MNRDELEKKAKVFFEDCDIFTMLSVEHVNHDPHPYVIGPKHIAHASDKHCGMLGEETLKAIPCAHPRCQVPYDQHTSDTVMFLQLKREATNNEVAAKLKELVTVVDEKSFDGVSFVDTKEKFRITK